MELVAIPVWILNRKANNIAEPEKPQNSGSCITAPASGACFNHFPLFDVVHLSVRRAVAVGEVQLQVMQNAESRKTAD
ncbi:MAG: hypothetical protein E5Y51_20960 [Mesorhizobium sp.]|nr:MAG: hypothetical protein E5Y51_20960 [Mesorhizobium sp.]